jgi:hypothetical protein
MTTNCTPEEIVSGYRNDSNQRLNMLGPFGTAQFWLETMRAALPDYNGTYNRFTADTVGAFLVRRARLWPELLFAPAREGSVTLYVCGPREAVLAMYYETAASRLGACETQLLAQVGGENLVGSSYDDLPETLYLRLWWN